MRTRSEEDARRRIRRDLAQFFECVGVVDFDAVSVAHRKPKLMAARGELHVQNRGPGFQCVDHLAGLAVNHFDRVVVGMCVVHPDVAAVRAGDGENGLAMGFGAPDFLQGLSVDPKHRVMPDSGQDKTVPGQRPAFEMRHFVYG